jgi:formylglycine-generating enzyme required for sulfatase activity
MHWLLALAVLLVALPTGAVTMDWVYVGNAGNSPDTAANCWADNCGSVSYAYYMSKYEVTNVQYVEFLNAKAASDPLGLYNTEMDDTPVGGISRSGMSGAYTYAVKTGFAQKPVIFVSFYDALRFVNWLSNGQGSGDTEFGAYTLLGGTPAPSNGLSVKRNPGATTFLTSENEWYKAAYYGPGGVYFDYPTGTDSETGCVEPAADTGNSANCYSAVAALTDVGAYALSGSPYGTFDQGGNVWELNEEIIIGVFRGLRGGTWGGTPNLLSAPLREVFDPTFENQAVGFRVASLVPEPGQGLLGSTVALVLGALRVRRTRRARSGASRADGRPRA